jgi:hypothetical protein
MTSWSLYSSGSREIPDELPLREGFAPFPGRKKLPTTASFAIPYLNAMRLMAHVI